MNTTILLLAARQSLAIIVLIVALVAGLTVATWLLPLGVLAYVIMVFFGMRDPVLIDAARRPPPTPRPRLASPTFRAQIEAIERTQQEIARSAAQSGGPLARLLLPIADQGRELVEEAYILADKGRSLSATWRLSIAVNSSRMLHPSISRCARRRTRIPCRSWRKRAGRDWKRSRMCVT